MCWSSKAANNLRNHIENRICTITPYLVAGVKTVYGTSKEYRISIRILEYKLSSCTRALNIRNNKDQATHSPRLINAICRMRHPERRRSFFLPRSEKANGYGCIRCCFKVVSSLKFCTFFSTTKHNQPSDIPLTGLPQIHLTPAKHNRMRDIQLHVRQINA